jgi:hypothetical protein
MRYLRFIGALSAIFFAFAPPARALDEAALALLITPANRIVLGENDAAWRPLAAAIAAQGSVFATFTEHRYLPFKKVPVVFTGELRLSPERGMSLHYTSPEDSTLIVDTQGVLVRDARGRSRELPSEPRARAATSALLHIMRFDLNALTPHFEIYGRKDGDAWQLAFDPREGELSGVLNRLIVSGQASNVQRIEMRRSALRSVETIIGEVHEHVTFSAAELAKFFR